LVVHDFHDDDDDPCCCLGDVNDDTSPGHQPTGATATHKSRRYIHNNPRERVALMENVI
jgi:hypothetical protein